MKKEFQDVSKVSSSSFKRNMIKLNTDKMILMDDEIENESYCTNYLNLDTEKNSNQSFGVCKISESDKYSNNSCIFDDNDVEKLNNNNQSVDIFTNRVNLNDDQYKCQNFQIMEQDLIEEKQPIEIIQLPKLKINKIHQKIRKNKKKKINQKKNHIKIKNISKFNFESLALRNIKTNFASGLIQFIQFKQELLIEQNDPKQDHIKNIIKFMYMKLPALRSFSGWREIWKDNNYGYAIRKISILFFSKFYIYDYINGSRVKQEYKQEYIRKIPKFISGAQNYHLFNSYNFNL